MSQDGFEIRGWRVVETVAAHHDVRRYRVSSADGRTGLMSIAAAGSAAAAELQHGSSGELAGEVIDRGLDTYGNPYAVVTETARAATPHAPALHAPVPGAVPVHTLGAAPQRMTRQTVVTFVTLASLVALVVAGVAIYRLVTPGPKTVRDFDILPVGSYEARIRCLHPAGVCDDAWTSGSAMDRIEVTHGQWKECADTGACPALSEASDDDIPVTNVSWEQASRYCNWRGGTLPSAELWEAAARGHDARLYPWGNDEPTCERANTNACGGEPSKAKRPAGASVSGFEDLAGNVAEWVRREPYAVADPEDEGPWLARGGSFRDGASEVTTIASRLLDGPASDVGFRCAYERRYNDDERTREIEMAETVVEARIEDAQRTPRPTRTTVAVDADIRYQSDTHHDYDASIAELLGDAGFEVGETGDLAIQLACVESNYGSYGYDLAGAGLAYGGGTPGTEVSCDVTIRGDGGSVTLTAGGVTGSTASSLYYDAIDDLQRSIAWRAIPVAVALVGGDESAADEVARLGFYGPTYPNEPLPALAKLALAHRDALSPAAHAMALISTGDPVAAATLGDAADVALARWATYQDDEPDLELGRALIAAGPTGERAVAAMLGAVPDAQNRYGEVSPELIIPWLQLFAAEGRTRALAESARRWEKSMNPEVAAAARAAIAAIDARLAEEGER